MQRWLRSTFASGLFGGLLLWAALPPLAWAPLAWLAPIPWVMLARRQELSGRHPYAQLWLASFVFWLAALYWLTLPHWATSIGWLALSFYLAFYLPAFVGLTRVAVGQLRISPIVAAPVVWMGLEIFRAHFFTGIGIAMLGHSQFRWPGLLQISDLGGAYLVGFVIVGVAACVARMLPCEGRRWTAWPLAPLVAAVAATLGYGAWRTSGDYLTPGPKVALIQGSTDIEMKHDPTQSGRIFEQYLGLSEQAVAQHPGLDLIVWPETMFRVPIRYQGEQTFHPYYTFSDDYRPPQDYPPTDQIRAATRQSLGQLEARLGAPLLIGVDRLHHTPERMEHYNSALLVDRSGIDRAYYDKVQRVMFGEYVPLADTFPWLYRLTPLPHGLAPGAGPKALISDGRRYLANICFESTSPHLIRSQVNQLRGQNEEPDVLVNLTNDGWFWGSSELDLHLACGVFRAVECRKPFLIAANTGFSAWISSDGVIVEQGPRRETGVIVAETSLDARRSPYLLYGDLPAGVCFVACVGLAIAGSMKRRTIGEPETKNPA